MAADAEDDETGEDRDPVDALFGQAFDVAVETAGTSAAARGSGMRAGAGAESGHVGRERAGDGLRGHVGAWYWRLFHGCGGLAGGLSGSGGGQTGSALQKILQRGAGVLRALFHFAADEPHDPVGHPLRARRCAARAAE